MMMKLPALTVRSHMLADTAFIDAEALGKALAPWLPDAAERDFVLRCVFDEGPAHHRGSNAVLLGLLLKLAEKLDRVMNDLHGAVDDDLARVDERLRLLPDEHRARDLRRIAQGAQLEGHGLRSRHADLRLKQLAHWQGCHPWVHT
jgi:hypothetical protein